MSWAALAAVAALVGLAFGLTVVFGDGESVGKSGTTPETGAGPSRGTLTWIDADPSWSPDGRRIVFTRGSTSNVAPDFNLRWVDLQTGRQRALTFGTGHRDRDPVWSPDGTAIAFVRSFGSGFCDEDDEISVISADRGAAKREPRVVGSGCRPAWSPDGSKIAFLRTGSLVVTTRDGARQVVVAPRLPLRKREGVFIPGAVFDFDWSPDGSRLALERSNEIWVVRADGGDLRRLTRSGHARVAHGPRWSADSELILHDRYDGGAVGLWVMRPDGKGARKIVDGEIDERAWSPDAMRIAYHGEDGLSVVDQQGRNQRRLPLDSFGAWAPDSRRIAVGGSTAGTLSPNPSPIVVINVETRRSTRATQRH